MDDGGRHRGKQGLQENAGAPSGTVVIIKILVAASEISGIRAHHRR